MQSLCLSESYAFYQETVAKNETVRIDYNSTEAIHYVQNDCFDNELTYQQYFQNTPRELMSIIDDLNVLQTDQACNVVFEDATVAADCMQAMNGILQEGLTNSNKYLFHYVLKQFVEFESIPGP
mmetsp:Transcript_42697/g.41012  ORF Transcript_42697/g.41012 Transcript_42697/m.41012 type:complete len:124 (-) Transcript_42697:392-763(-)